MYEMLAQQGVQGGNEMGYLIQPSGSRVPKHWYYTEVFLDSNSAFITVIAL